MPSSDTITTIFRHHLWANLRIVEQCAALTAEQLDATVSGAYGSIRNTLQHIVTAEQSYFSRISTGRPYRRPAGAPPLSLEEMAESLRTTGNGLIAWAPAVQAEDSVPVDWEGAPREVPKAIILTQAINHATEHRAQIMVMLTQLGQQPWDVDGWTYFDASST
jgi:uncharacterized damage-inducible protein DinB